MKFAIESHIEIDQHYQGINLTEFSFLENNISDQELIDTFIKSEYFTLHSQREVVVGNRAKINLPNYR